MAARVRSVGLSLLMAGVAVFTGVEAGPDAAAAPMTTLRTAAVLINFSDDPIDPSPEYRASVAEKYFGSSHSLRTYYEEASDRRMSFAPLAGRRAVLGPWTIYMAATCDHKAMEAEVRRLLTARGISRSDFDRLSIVFPNGKANCPWGGLGRQPGSVTWLPSGFKLGPLIHEMGHNFGYHHLHGLGCDEGGLANCAELGWRGSSPMGKGFDFTGLAAPELVKSGWYTPEQRLVDPANGSYTLVPLHAEADVSGLRMLDVPIDDNGGRVVVSYREPGRTIDARPETGVMLHKTTVANYGRSWLVDATPVSSPDDDNVLPPGAAITAPNGRKIAVESVAAGSAVIRIG